VYGPQNRNDSGTKVVTYIVGLVLFQGRKYFKLMNGNQLTELCRDVYEWNEGRKASKQWRGALEETTPRTITASERAREQF